MRIKNVSHRLRLIVRVLSGLNEQTQPNMDSEGDVDLRLFLLVVVGVVV